MEPPPGPRSSPPGPRPVPRSSPPGPRPVPPPRKGSMERRPLSPPRSGGEQPGAWDTASDVIARGSKAWTPEKATVTQRVLIVMRSHASPPESTPIQSWGASPPLRGDQEMSQPESTPIQSWGASPPPRTSKWDQETSPPESTPIQSWGASPPLRTSMGDQETSPPESTPIQSWGASPPPRTSMGDQETSQPENTPITSWGASPPPKGDQETSPPESTPITSWGASPPQRTSKWDQETSQPESTPIQSWGASPPQRTTKWDQETSQPESTTITSWGASPPPRTSKGDQKTSPPESTPIQSWGASPPLRTSKGDQETSQPENTLITSWGASPPPRTPKWDQEMSQPQGTPIENLVTAPLPRTSKWDQEMSQPESTPITSWGTSQPKRTSKGDQEMSPPLSTSITSWDSSSPPRTSTPPDSTPITFWRASPPLKTSTPPESTSKGDQETSPPESTPIENRVTARLPRTSKREQGTSPPDRAAIPSWETSPPPRTSKWDQDTSPSPSIPIQNQGAAPPPSTRIENRVTAPLPRTSKEHQEMSPPESILRSAAAYTLHNAPTLSSPIQKQAAAPPSSTPIQNQDVAPTLTIPVQGQGAPPTQDTQRTRGSESLQGHSEIRSTPTGNMALTSRELLANDIRKDTEDPPIMSVQNHRTALQHSTTQDQAVSLPADVESRGRSPQADVFGHSSVASPNCTGAQDFTKTHDNLLSQQGEGIQEVVITWNVCQTGVTLTDGVSQSRTPQDFAASDTKSAAAVRPEDTKSAAAVRPEDTKSAAAVRPEDTKSAAAVRPEDTKSAAAVRPEDTKSAAAVRPEDTMSAATVRPEDTKSAATVRPEDTKSAATVRPEDTKSAATVRPEDTKTAATVRPEDKKSAAAVRPEDTKSAAAAQSITTILPNLNTQEEVEQKQGGDPVVGNITQTHTNSASQSETSNVPAQPSLGWPSLSPIRVPDPSSPHRNISSKPPLPIPPRSSLYPGHPLREQETSASHETVSLSSLKSKAPAPDTLSYLDSVSLMSGTMESLTILDDASSLGSDSEINGMPYRKTDKYGFLGGNQFSGNGETTIPVEIARLRELKWLDMFSNWDKWLTRRFQKVKLRCRKGIPSSLRAKAWQFLSNSHELLAKNPGKFEEMERQHGDPKWLDVIEKDLHRQFPFHEMFAARGGHGQQDLYRILKAYTVYRPEEGYCQAQAPVAAVLLMHMPAEQAFWCLVQICDKYLPGYYSAGLEAIQLDGEIFFALLRSICPMAYRHLKKFKIDPILYMTEWFMCIFSRTLPWASVLRVWDMFFCEGVKIVFRVGLVLLRHTLGSVDKLRSCQGMYETMEKLRSLPVYCMQEDVLLPEVSSLPVADALIEKQSNTQLRKWRENRGELQYRPSRRLHGARQIFEEKLRLNPTLSGSRLSLSSIRRPSPPATPVLAVQPESVVVSEGLRPALPSPTSNKAPLGPPRGATKKGKEKQREQEKKREKEEREREKKKEKEEREERRKEKEREKQKEKEREKQKEKEEKRVQKDREKAEARQKKERKFSFRRKESSAPDSPQNSGSGATESGAAHDTYF